MASAGGGCLQRIVPKKNGAGGTMPKHFGELLINGQFSSIVRPQLTQQYVSIISRCTSQQILPAFVFAKKAR